MRGMYSAIATAMAGLGEALPDVLLIDTEMIGVNEGDVVSAFRMAFPSLMILMMTDVEGDTRVLDALREGASGCVMFNCSAAELASAIQHARHGGSPLPLSIARIVLPLLRRSRPPAPQVLKLSPREDKIMQLLVKGLHYKEIAAELTVSPSTVRAHLHTVYNKLKVGSRAEAVLLYVKGSLGLPSVLST